MATTARNARPAILHGTRVARPVGETWVGGVVAMAPRPAPTAAPHLWQNRAPGVRGLPQEAQVAPRRDAPHSAQNLPEAAAPHEGQVDLDGAFIDAVKVRPIQTERLADQRNQ